MKKLEFLLCDGLRGLVRLCYRKPEFVGLEHLPEEPCIIVGNHAQTHGPIVGELYFPGKPYIWCAGEMMHLTTVPAYAYRDFWSRKPKTIRWLFKLASYLIAPLSVLVFNNVHTIGVYRDKRILSTFQITVEKLQAGNNVIIFPEHDAPYNDILCDFQDGFVRVARNFYHKTGKKLAFVPMYLAPSLKKVVLGEPVCFDPETPIKEERRRITQTLMERITQMAVSLPRHIVVPYNNVSKKEYGYNQECIL